MNITHLIEAANLLSNELVQHAAREPLRIASERLLANPTTPELVDFLNELERSHEVLGATYPYLGTLIESTRRALHLG